MFTAVYCLASEWLDEITSHPNSNARLIHIWDCLIWQRSPNLTISSKLAAAPNWYKNCSDAGFYTKGRPLAKSNLICPSDKLSWQHGCPVLNINIQRIFCIRQGNGSSDNPPENLVQTPGMTPLAPLVTHSALLPTPPLPFAGSATAGHQAVKLSGHSASVHSDSTNRFPCSSSMVICLLT